MAISAKRPDGPVLLRMPDSVGDAELVERAVRGDRWGREVLYRRHAAYLLGLATRLFETHPQSAGEALEHAERLGTEELHDAAQMRSNGMALPSSASFDDGAVLFADRKRS